MPRFPTFHQTIDEALTVKISNLNRWGYLKCHSVGNGSLSWRRGGRKIGSIGFAIITIEPDLKRIVFDYTFREMPINYSVEIMAIPTNLGNGKRWYFVCPRTGNHCMNLIKPTGSKYFLHRSAFPSMLYESQKESKHERKIKAALGAFFGLDDLLSEMNKKYRKTHYRGKPTPLMRKIEAAYRQQPSMEEVNRLFFR